MSRRIFQLQVALLAAFSLLALRLVHLQVVRGAHYRRLAEQNRLRVVPEPAPRGMIVDRYGRVLAENQTVFQAAIVPQEMQDASAVFTRLGQLLQRPPQVLQRAYEKERWLAFVPAPVVSRIPKAAALRLEEERWRLPGVLVRSEVVRHYPYGASAAQLIGHLSQPTPEELPGLKTYGVQPKQLVGRLGLERSLDDVLRGRPGGLVVEVNHRGRQVRTIGHRDAEPGARVALTVDIGLQSLVEQAFGSQAGAAVFLDPDSGAVRAMVSNPLFTPESFAMLDNPAIRGFFADPSTPMVNRASSGAYQPGSIAKLATAAGALEHRVILPQTTVICRGAMQIGDRTIHCWKRDGHGPVDLTGAIMQSCNVYFMQVGRWLGRQRLQAAMEQAGFSKKTGWVMDEQAGHLPHRRLSEGEVALLAIGQGEILVTVLQVAVLSGAMANGGWLVEPWVVTEVDGHPRRAPPKHRIGWSAATVDALRAGMREVVRNPHGTAFRAYTPEVTIAGKTGTAQTHVAGFTHGWFIGYCPIDRPRVAMAIMAEYGGSGSDLPSEIARTACEYVAAVEGQPAEVAQAP